MSMNARGNESASRPLENAGNRPGIVELDDSFLGGPPVLADESGFLRRMEEGRELAETLREENPFLDEQRLSDLLRRGLEESKLDALIIATREGFVVAQAARTEVSDLLPIIGSLVEETVARAEAEGVVRRMDEMFLRGADGEQIAVRYFPQTAQRFFLLAYSGRKCTYRRVTNRILRECGPMLAAF